jgi:ferredoxin-NADP reductase
MRPGNDQTTPGNAFPLREVPLVARRIMESANAASFYLSAPDEKPLPVFSAGQYVRVHAPDGRVAPYFLSAFTRLPSNYRFTVLRQPDDFSDVSRFLFDEFVSGESLVISGPFGEAVLPEDSKRPIVFVSRGIGSVVAVTLGDELAQRRTRPFIGFVHIEQRQNDPVILGAKFRSLCAEMKKASFVSLGIDTPQDELIKLIARCFTGDERAGLDNEAPLCVLCGAEAFVQPLSRALQDQGVDLDLIKTLSFGSLKIEYDAPLQTQIEVPDLTPRVVTFRCSGKTATWTATDGTLLDFATAQGINLPFSCRTGMCGTCSQRLNAGDVANIRVVTVRNISAGSILLCSCVPVSDITLEI